MGGFQRHQEMEQHGGYLSKNGVVRVSWHTSTFLGHENIRSIGEIWGKVICLDARTERMESICQTKLLVQTNNMRCINDRILVQTELEGFEVWVKESLPNIPVIKCNPWLEVNLEETEVDESLNNYANNDEIGCNSIDLEAELP